MKSKLLSINIFLLLILLHQTNSPSQTLSKIKPEMVGISSARLNRIDTLMDTYIQQHKIAGAVTFIARRGKVVYFKPFGMMDIQKKKPMKRDAIFRIASMTKPIVSVAMMILYEEGRFQLDDPISLYIPELKGLKVLVPNKTNPLNCVPAKREMTIQDLMRHTSGLSGGWGNTPIDSMYQTINYGPGGTLKDMIHTLGKIPLLYQPGECWQYSISVDVLGYLVEVLSGKPLDEYLAEHIFKPLGMNNTGFYVSEEKLNRFTTLYGKSEDGSLKVLDAPDTSSFSKKPSFFSGCGGLVSTVSDYAQFAQMLLNKGDLEGIRILSPKTVDLMTVNHVPMSVLPLSMGDPAFEFLVNGCGFGLGFAVIMNTAIAAGPRSQGSYGWFGYNTTNFWIDQKEQLIGIIMSPFEPPPPYPAVREFQVLMYQSIID